MLGFYHVFISIWSMKMAKQSNNRQREKKCGISKYEEMPVKELPGCDIFSIRMRPRNVSPNDVNDTNWQIVSWNIEKKSPNCQITAVGDTLEQAVKAMKEILNIASTYKIDTYNGVPGSGLSKVPDDISKIKIKHISQDVFYDICVSVGPWRSDKKSRSRRNNNCGRQQIHQEMQKLRIYIEQELITNNKKR